MCNCGNSELEITSLSKNIVNDELYIAVHCNPDVWTNDEILNKKSDKNSQKHELISDDSVRLLTAVNEWKNKCQCFQGQSDKDQINDNDSIQKFNAIIEKKIFSSENNQDKLEDELDIECTLAIIKPDAFHDQNLIIQRIIDEGFTICEKKIVKLTPEQIFQLYYMDYGKIYFPHLIAYMTSGPIVIFMLSKHNAIRKWKFIIGPKNVKEAKLYYPESIRALFSRNHGNAVHGSLNLDEAQKEIQFFFPGVSLEPFIIDELENYLHDNVYHVLKEGLVMLCRERPFYPIIWLANWLYKNNPQKPKISKT